VKEPLFELSLLPQAVSARVRITGIPEECSRNTVFAVKLPESRLYGQMEKFRFADDPEANDQTE
jgi:hypothetical protein